MSTLTTWHHDDHAHKHPEDTSKRQSKGQPGLVGAVKETFSEFAADDVMTQSAALAFYSGLAMAPLLTLAVWAMQVFFGDEAKRKIVESFQSVMGQSAAAPIQQMLDPASEQAKQGMTIAGIISLIILAFSASSVFGQLQMALNRIWSVKAKPGNSILGFINKRLLSLGMLASLLFLLMTSLVMSTVLQGFLGTGGDEGKGIFGMIVDIVISLALFWLMFAMLFKYVPDAKVTWRSVWVGGLISAVLFTVGKIALGIYLGRGSYENSYGAAIGSFVALLVWVYYSAIIVLIGAEATEVYAKRHGHAVEPSEHAVRVVEEEKEVV